MNTFYKKNKLTPIINASGFMTKIGASIASRISIKAANEILSNFVNIDELQSLASKKISQHLGCEGAIITASAAAGLTESVAGIMTGNKLINILKLPNTKNMKNQVLIQKGHLTNYGAEVEQGIRLSGAKILKCGNKNFCKTQDVVNTIKNNNNIVCAMFVVSHHCVEYKSLPIKEFINICHNYKIPVIVDAASEEYMKYFFNINADIAIFSAHKFMKSLTAGIIAGKKKYIQNIYKQNIGIGRGMKVGKESIYAAIISIDKWHQRDIVKELMNQNKIIKHWITFFNNKKYKGVYYEIIPDPTGNKINRLRIYINKKMAGFTPQSLAYNLEQNNPSIFIRDDLINFNHFELDTCNLKKNEEKIVAVNIDKIIKKMRNKKLIHNLTLKQYKRLNLKSFLNWPN